jgi:hypothetical protein
MTTPNPAAIPGVTGHYETLASAVHQVLADVCDYCDEIRVQAEQRTGSTDEDLVVLDHDYRQALNVYDEIAQIRDAVEHFRRTWIGENR